MILYILSFFCLLLILIYPFNKKGLFKPIKKFKKKKNLLIITYNIQKFPIYFKTFNQIQKLLNKYSIILLQECFNINTSTLQYYFPNYYICYDTLKGYNILNSGLVILSKFPITKYISIKFNYCNHCTLDQFSEKGFLLCWIKIKHKHICIINTHLQSSSYARYDKYATLQFKQILDYIKNIKEPIILGGDFNIDIQDIKNIFPRLKYNSSDNPTIYMNLKNGHSISVQKNNYEPFTFDYFITKKIKLQNIHIPEYNLYSDHNPVSALITCN